jgi:pyridoxal phosphate enzyme (YggS family)
MRKAVQESERCPEDLLLLAVSKMQDCDSIRLAVESGIHNFGENYLQEAMEKMTVLKHLSLDWHFIGPLQSNKTKQVAENFNWVHSVDRLKIAQRLNKQRPQEKGPLNICLQVNIDQEEGKSGFSQQQALELATTIAQLPNLTLRGLMTLPKKRYVFDEQREPFQKLRLLKDQINSILDHSRKLDTLSMGMSSDLEAAIYEGATVIRVGTEIFGQRNI